MTTAPSDYLQHLPELFRAEPASGTTPFVGDFLKTFEAMLSGRDDADVGGERVTALEELIDAYVHYLDPALTPVSDTPATPGLDSEFLDYLASWVALTLDQNWPLDRKREWLRRIVPLYKRRGTLAGLTQYLGVFVGDEARIQEPAGEFVLGVTSTVAVDTFVGEAPAYYFRVVIEHGFLPDPFDVQQWRNIRSGTTAIIDLEKPAHTYYSLDARAPGFIIDVRSTVATDTFLWTNSS